MKPLRPFTGTSPEPATYELVPAAFGPDAAADVARWWPNHDVGTGGVASEAFFRQAYGYPQLHVVETAPVESEAPYTRDMRQVKAGFGRTMSCLPGVFGVSRQTLYDWLAGHTPKERHHEPLHQLANAAVVFMELGFTPTAAAFNRTLAHGQSFLQLVASGANGKDAAKSLVSLVRRGHASRTKLDDLLKGRKSRLVASDFGAPFPDDKA